MNDLTTSATPAFKAFLRGVSGLLFGIGGISFLFGGRAIREFAKADIVLSEMAAIFVAIVCLGLGALAKSAGEEDVNEEEEQSS
jgi:NADH:ubiquinone oxidoreductase subunit 5 (subunit L)/multisubunit Na+/H+ antiporter MnhA subunit